MNSLATTTIDEVLHQSWDVVVIGAGPAGGLAGYELARRGLKILMVERSPLPRWKVCGACVNEAALATLEAAGLDRFIEDLPNIPLAALQLCCSGLHATVPLGKSRVISRARLDLNLAAAAVREGAELLTNVTARLAEPTADGRRVELSGHDGNVAVEAKVVLVAAGLAGESMTCPTGSNASHQRATPSNAIKTGAGVIVEQAPSYYQPGHVYMAVGQGGYVGLVRQEDARLNIAAAFDRQWLREYRSPGRLAARILAEAGLPRIEQLEHAPWRGTAYLTRRAGRLALERVFLIGDSAGYVEPFTGEGIAWALESAFRVAPIVERGVSKWDASLIDEWQAVYEQAVGRRQRACRWIAAGLRHGRWVAVATRLLSRFPWLARPLVEHLGRRSTAPYRRVA